jgi:hypothetical protein
MRIPCRAPFRKDIEDAPRTGFPGTFGEGWFKKFQEVQDMFFELREYRIKDEKRERWVKLMEEKIIPFQMSKGMVAVGSFVAVDEPDLYVWIRRFENEEEAERLYKEVYESEYWRTEIKPQADEMLDRERMRITRLEATEKSVIR